MELTKEILLKNGFKQINNSMFRLENITLQNGYTSHGNNVIDKIFNTKKAYKACIDGKFICMIITLDELITIKLLSNAHKNY